MIMKQTALFLLLILLLPAGSLAVEKDDTLFPIRENGLWGYMNRAGEVVIEPQWIHAWPFDGNTALVSTREIPAYVEPHGDGIIGKDGNYVVTPAPEQTINEDTYAYRIRNADDGEGFYDKASGFYQPPLPEYSMVMLWSEDGQGPIAVERTDGLTGYVNRTTGETDPVHLYRRIGRRLFLWRLRKASRPHNPCGC